MLGASKACSTLARCTGRAARALPLSPRAVAYVLRQSSHWQTSGLQRAPAWKHSQYFLRHLERLQRQPRLWPSVAVTCGPKGWGWVGVRGRGAAVRETAVGSASWSVGAQGAGGRPRERGHA